MSVPVRLSNLRSFLARHWLITTLLVAGLTLRVLTWLAYQPALLYLDSFFYLGNIGEYRPDHLHPIGYPLFVLGPVLSVGGLELVTALQHVAVLLAAVALYALALRHGAPRWLGAIAAAPLLLDAYQVQIEQMIMTDTWQQVLLVAVLWLLLSRGAPSPRRAALAGLLLGMMVLLRLIAVVFVIPAVCYLVIAGGAWRALCTWPGLRTVALRTGALVAMFAVVVVSYATYFYSETGQFRLSGTSANVLYGRAAVVADCDRIDDPLERIACPDDEPLAERKSKGIDAYAHASANEEWTAQFPEGTDISAVQESFGWTVLRNQPVDVVSGIVVDFFKGFRPAKMDAEGDVQASRWHFQENYQYYGHVERSTEASLKYSGKEPSDIPAVGSLLRSYQLSVGFMPGTLLGVMAIIGVLAGIGVKRARHSGLRAAALLPVGLGVTVLGASAIFEFSWRYQLPALVTFPLAAAIGIAAFLRRRRSL